MAHSRYWGALCGVSVARTAGPAHVHVPVLASVRGVWKHGKGATEGFCVGTRGNSGTSSTNDNVSRTLPLVDFHQWVHADCEPMSNEGMAGGASSEHEAPPVHDRVARALSAALWGDGAGAAYICHPLASPPAARAQPHGEWSLHGHCFEQCRALFDSPTTRARVSSTAANPFGCYHYRGTAEPSADGATDSGIDAFLFGLEDAEQWQARAKYTALRGAEIPAHRGSNQWPDDMDIQTPLRKLFENSARIADDVLGALSLAKLGDRSLLPSAHSHHDSTLEVKRYRPRHKAAKDRTRDQPARGAAVQNGPGVRRVQLGSGEWIEVGGRREQEARASATPQWEGANESVRAHTDLSSVTLLYQDAHVGFLQVWVPRAADSSDRFGAGSSHWAAQGHGNSTLAHSHAHAHAHDGPLYTPYGDEELFADGTWVDVSIPPGCVLLTVGDILSRWIGCPPSYHRVVQPPSTVQLPKERFSAVFFCQPNWDESVSRRYPVAGNGVVAGEETEEDTSASILVGDMLPYG
eukprot:TRINITY_DN13412_c0_g1_i1.p1 TRINITY_DN13412_c0_g1~~TRINITY_DN13412_c0_g1_i1.p1  ORF type:complete len:522 (-),score=58.89 TRINITY_DN13412_c0_g1_i1:431-1996(-)